MGKVETCGIVSNLLAGISAAVVGLLLSAFFDPVWVSMTHSSKDFAIGVSAFIFLEFYKWPQWLIVILCSLTAIIV